MDIPKKYWWPNAYNATAPTEKNINGRWNLSAFNKKIFTWCLRMFSFNMGRSPGWSEGSRKRAVPDTSWVVGRKQSKVVELIFCSCLDSVNHKNSYRIGLKFPSTGLFVLHEWWSYISVLLSVDGSTDFRQRNGRFDGMMNTGLCCLWPVESTTKKCFSRNSVCVHAAVASPVQKKKYRPDENIPDKDDADLIWLL